MKFSFIDLGLKDFIRDDNNEVLIIDFPSYDMVEDFIMDGGLYKYDWTNKGTLKFCWDEYEYEDNYNK